MTLHLNDDEGLELVAISPGTFEMGGSKAALEKYGAPERYYGRELPQRNISISRPFAVSTTLVTVAQFSLFVSDTGHEPAHWCEVWNGDDVTFDKSLSWRNPGFAQEDDHPVVAISWNDAQAYLKWLGSRLNRTYRLLSDAEFEYASRAGSQSLWIWGDDEALQHTSVNTQNSPQWPHTSAVKSYEPNSNGLYDMIGNVWEWTQDSFVEGSITFTQDPVAIPDSELRVIRGGGWNSRLFDLRNSARQRDYCWHNDQDIGFRVARDLDAAELRNAVSNP